MIKSRRASRRSISDSIHSTRSYTILLSRAGGSCEAEVFDGPDETIVMLKIRFFNVTKRELLPRHGSARA